MQTADHLEAAGLDDEAKRIRQECQADANGEETAAGIVGLARGILKHQPEAQARVNR
jgi:hypothetical protein